MINRIALANIMKLPVPRMAEEFRERASLIGDAHEQFRDRDMRILCMMMKGKGGVL